MKDLAELQDKLVKRGYTHDFANDADALLGLAAGDRGIVDTISFDQGTDPGDDATMYLIEAGGHKGYLMLSDSYHVDPKKAALLKALLEKT